ncbi:MAG: hypothetical protein J1F01_10045 [Oscillospiraceae bacterium]|nr:hypothetical protein [Oscillospiraceae bacterium]
MKCLQIKIYLRRNGNEKDITFTGIPLNKWFFETMVTSHFGNTWTFPVGAIVIILVLVAVSCIAAVYAPSKRIRGMSIIDTIHTE